MAAKRLGCKVVLHLLDVPEEELWRRVQLRNAGQPDGGFRISRNELKEWDTWFARPDQTELKIYDAVKVYRGA
jgi:predicted kinase